MAASEWRVRLFEPSDLPFLQQMYRDAAYWSTERPQPPLEQVLASPEINIYIAGWGRKGDTALIALGADERPIGAAWYRIFSSDRPGYGFIDASIPELAIAVVAGYRRKGVGTALLTALLEQARMAGLPAVCLSAQEINPSLRLYEKIGFTKVAWVDNAWTMRFDLV